jgi:hypothetical protein
VVVAGQAAPVLRVMRGRAGASVGARAHPGSRLGGEPHWPTTS